MNDSNFRHSLFFDKSNTPKRKEEKKKLKRDIWLKNFRGKKDDEVEIKNVSEKFAAVSLN